MRSSILRPVSLCAQIRWPPTTYILKASDGLVYVARRKFVELFVVAKDDDCHVDRAENGKLMRLLE